MKVGTFAHLNTIFNLPKHAFISKINENIITFIFLSISQPTDSRFLLLKKHHQNMSWRYFNCPKQTILQTDREYSNLVIWFKH